ncbi:BLOC-1-related complex subunit 8 isoform X1 [Delphinus delphis]|uniref:BLOC-1-related complex subunit 8 isoform X1 n=1 Tax=Delphinus delphis TaxID=9728 RepID=UPI00375198FF
MEEPEMQLKGKKVTDKFTESVYVLANEPSVALYRLQEHVRRSLPELAQHKRREEPCRQQRLLPQRGGPPQTGHQHPRPHERHSPGPQPRGTSPALFSLIPEETWRCFGPSDSGRAQQDCYPPSSGIFILLLTCCVTLSKSLLTLVSAFPFCQSAH